ncbi:hypothetical protein [Clostridium thermarum]|uniref:hypothetical protein n=1 Tax=Clostridium thermarum TaxID=1716543 RepID=UPI00111D4569|nr:hypothetical protein [Clostridium thermarum]
MASDWRWYITLANPAGFALGIPDDGQWAIDDEKQEAKYKFTVEGMKDYYKWLNKLNAEGLLDPESFTHKYDVYIAKLSSGRVLGLADAAWDYQDAVKSLVAANKAERTWAPLPVVVDETKHCWQVEAGEFEILIGSSSEDIRQRAIFTVDKDLNYK